MTDSWSRGGGVPHRDLRLPLPGVQNKEGDWVSPDNTTTKNYAHADISCRGQQWDFTELKKQQQKENKCDSVPPTGK